MCTCWSSLLFRTVTVKCEYFIKSRTRVTHLSLNVIVAQSKNCPFGIYTTIELKHITTFDNIGIWRGIFWLKCVPVYVIFLSSVIVLTMARMAQSVKRLATGWSVLGSNPGEGEIFRTCPDRSWGPPSLLYNGYRAFRGGKAAGAWRLPPTPI